MPQRFFRAANLQNTSDCLHICLFSQIIIILTGLQKGNSRRVIEEIM